MCQGFESTDFLKYQTILNYCGKITEVSGVSLFLVSNCISTDYFLAFVPIGK